MINKEINKMECIASIKKQLETGKGWYVINKYSEKLTESNLLTLREPLFSVDKLNRNAGECFFYSVEG